MHPCFAELNAKCTIRKDLLDLCQDNSDWIDPEVGTFLQKRPPQSLIFNDPVLKKICENYISPRSFLYCVNIFMIKPWTHYMLHADIDRSASVNLLINDHTDSISYFKVSEPYNKLHINIQELAYKPDTFYLFNSKIPHAVTNRNTPRYLLSITLNNDFNTMKNHFQGQLFL